MLKVNNTALASALSRAASIVESRNTIQILSSVRLTASGQKLTITTTNTDIEYRQTLECFADEALDVCVDAKRLAQMASAATGDITMSLDAKALTVKAGRSKWAAPVLLADTFPAMAVDALSKPLKIDGEELAAIVNRTLWAASKEAARHYLNGIFFNAGTFVATDGTALAMIETGHKWEGSDVIAPTAYMKAIAGAASGACSLEWDAKKMRFTCGDVTITGKLVDGKYPDYRRVIPEPCEPWAVDADALAGAVKRVRISSDAQQKKLRIKRGDGVVTVRIEGTSGFEGEEELPADCSEGFESGVNADYLAVMLGALDTDSVTVEQGDPISPFVFRPASQKPGMSFTGILMGMRI